MFTFSEMLALVQSESSFGAFVFHRRPAGLQATSDLVSDHFSLYRRQYTNSVILTFVSPISAADVSMVPSAQALETEAQKQRKIISSLCRERDQYFGEVGLKTREVVEKEEEMKTLQGMIYDLKKQVAEAEAKRKQQQVRN